MSNVQPHIRLLSAGGLIVATMLVPLSSMEGWVVLGIVFCLSVLAASATPARAHRHRLVVVWITITATFGIAPWVAALVLDPSLRSSSGVLSLAGIAARSASTSAIALFVVSSMGIAEVHRGLARFPFPHTFKVLTLHILHQAGLLLAETRRVHQAIAVRSASSRVLASWLLIRSLPQVWLSRVMHRSERVAHALELRGIGGEGIAYPRTTLRLADWLALCLSTGFLVLTALLVQ